MHFIREEKIKEYKYIMTRDDKYKVGFPTEFTEANKLANEYENSGWHLHTYQVVYNPSMMDKPGYYHFLLFEKEKS